METILDRLETLVRQVAAALGLLAISMPLLRVWRGRQRPRGRSSGQSTVLTRWPAFFAITAAYVAVGALLWKPVPLTWSSGLRSILTLIGALLYFPGIFLYIWGFQTLGPMFGVSSGISTQLYKGHRLIQKGPYAIVRHPMYLGVLMAAMGALLIFRTWTMVIYAPSAFGIIVRARREERLLEAEFGEAWTRYRERVPAWIPRIRRS